MKTIFSTSKSLILNITIASFLLFSCENEENSEKPDKPIAEELGYQINPETISLKWTAFKTTAKKPVGGEFKTVNVKDYSTSESIEKTIDNTSFSIPVSSLFTGNDVRDIKLVNLFFGIMDNTELLSGVFHYSSGDAENGNGVMDLTMNGKTCDLPYNYSISNDSIFISTTLNLKDWNGQEAIDSLNVACKDLHKGEDGISKTWNEVEIKASVGIIRK